MADHELATTEEVEEAESHSSMYIRVWVALLVLTVLEYFYAKLMAGSMINLIAGLLLLAGIKAALVAWYFMHVKFEGKWVYAVMVPAAILACVLIFGLIPDVALHESHAAEAEDDLAALTAPWNPTDSVRVRI